MSTTTSDASTVLGTDFLSHLESEGDSENIEQRRTATRRSLMATTAAVAVSSSK